MSNAPADYATRRWNPTTGCSPVSAGCANCWARRFANRHRGRFGYPADEPFRPTCHPDRLDEPLRWRKPQVVAVSFMGDLFHEAIPDEFIAAVFGVMAAAERHTFLLLTKRPSRMRSVLSADHEYTKLAEEFCAAHNESDPVFRALNRGWFVSMPLPNVWPGVSVEDQPTADERIGVLVNTPAAHRLVSLKPQIGPVEFAPWWLDPGRIDSTCPHCLAGATCQHQQRGLEWIVQGCESGPGRRPFDLAWARSVRDQCEAARIPYYLKQMPDEAWTAERRGIRHHPRIVKHPYLDGRQHLDLPWKVGP